MKRWLVSFALGAFGFIAASVLLAQTTSFCGQFSFPCWTTANRPATPGIGTTGFNLSFLTLESWNGTIWAQSGGGTGFASQTTATSTRSNNTTTYTANTAWSSAAGAVLTFTNVCEGVGTSVLIPQISLIDAANQATPLQGILWLFSVSPTAIADNATFSIAAADWLNVVSQQPFVASVIMNQTSGAGGATMSDLTAVGIQGVCAAADRNLYGLIQVVNAYVPLANEQLTVIVKAVGVD